MRMAPKEWSQDCMLQAKRHVSPYMVRIDWVPIPCGISSCLDVHVLIT